MGAERDLRCFPVVSGVKTENRRFLLDLPRRRFAGRTGYQIVDSLVRTHQVVVLHIFPHDVVNLRAGKEKEMVKTLGFGGELAQK